MQRKVSVIIPVIRPLQIPALEDQIYNRAGIPAADIEILTMEDENRVGAPKMVKNLVQIARHNYVMYLGDDCEPELNFILNAFKEMKKFKGNWGLVGLNCGRWIWQDYDPKHEWQSFLDHGEVAQHWMAHKELLKHLDGEFFHTGYTHCFCDNELTQRVKALKRYRYCEKSRIIHHHPIVMEDESLWDEDLKRVYDAKVYDADRRLFNTRKAHKWNTRKKSADFEENKKKVLVCVPLYGEGFQKFWMCLSRMQFKCLSAGIDTFLRVKASAVVEHSRNVLISEGLRDFPDCTHFLFIDADMTFDDDLLIRLMEHDKDMVAVNAYRKAPPYHPVVSVDGGNGDYFHPVHVKPEDGELQRVSSSGTGCVLIKRPLGPGLSCCQSRSR